MFAYTYVKPEVDQGGGVVIIFKVILMKNERAGRWCLPQVCLWIC